MSPATVEADGPLEMMEQFEQRGWTDGLPIVPPTADRVDELLATVERARDEVVLHVAETERSVTVEMAAINAVMAGCFPACFPVVIATIDGWSDPRWGRGVRNRFYMGIASTGGGGQLQLVNGPIRHELGMNGGINVYGPGRRANATIGRAMRLILMNGVGMRPGELDMSSQGHPGKYSYCLAENEEDSPWEPLHVEHGFPATTSTVYTMSARGPEPVENRHSDRPEEVLLTIADTMSRLGGKIGHLDGPGSPILVVMGPEHAHRVARRGWTKRDAKEFLALHARRPLEDLQRIGREVPDDRIRRDDGVDYVEVVAGGADDVEIVVAGGYNAGVSSVVTGWVHRVPLGDPIITPIRAVATNDREDTPTGSS
jgi:hypothetical protein